MGMEVNLFQAGSGDCILVRCGEETSKVNILIDSGMSKSYFLKALDRIITNEEKIDLLVFTHDDNDHIKGACSLLEQIKRKKSAKKSGKLCIGGRISEEAYKNLLDNLTDERILFNFGGNGTDVLLGVKEAKSLFESFKEIDIPQLEFVLSDAEESPDVPYPNMLQLIWQRVGSDLYSSVIRQPHKKDLETEKEHLELVILSPSKEGLVSYIHSAWDKLQKKEIILKADKKRTSVNEWEKTIQYWLSNQIEDKATLSPANKASIAFLLIYGERCGLFAGDASPVEMVRAGKEYLARKKMKQDYLEVDFIKLPHHGSRHNVNKEFLEFFRTKTFFITTNGNAKNKHPGKVTLALIASVLKNNETAHIYSSYSWWKENKDFSRSEKNAGNWSEDLCILKDVDGNLKYLHFHKTELAPVIIGKDISVRR